MDAREQRIGLNEALYREVNERLRGVNEAFGSLTRHASLLCECGRADCALRITMTLDAYEHVRARPDQFAVAPGHADPTDVEWVAEDHDGWHLVRKRPGAPARLAAETDRDFVARAGCCRACGAGVARASSATSSARR